MGAVGLVGPLSRTARPSRWTASSGRAGFGWVVLRGGQRRSGCSVPLVTREMQPQPQ